MNFLNSILKLKEPKKSLRGVTYIKYALILTLSPYFFNMLLEKTPLPYTYKYKKMSVRVPFKTTVFSRSK